LNFPIKGPHGRKHITRRRIYQHGGCRAITQPKQDSPMPMSLTNANVVLNLAKGIVPNVDDLRYAADRQRDRMVRRTGQGIDYKGSAFTPYSPAYAKRKSQSGRDSGVVDLTWSGRMLKAMRTSRVAPGGFTIGIYGDEGTRGAVHNEGLGKMPKRRFMDASEEDRARILKDIAARCMARANGGGLNLAKAA
jgi:hypothetical protein